MEVSALIAFDQHPGWIGLLEEGVGRFEWSGEKDNPPRVLCDSGEGCGSGCRRGGPDEEYRIDAIEAGIKRVGTGEISLHHLDLWREMSRFGRAHEGAELGAGRRQLCDDMPRDVTGAADDEDAIRECPVDAPLSVPTSFMSSQQTTQK